jgi:selenocysteine-specific elongation factor
MPRDTRWQAAGVVDPTPPRRGRSRPERLAALAALAEPDPRAALSALGAAAGIVELATFATVRNLAPDDAAGLAETAGLLRLGGARNPVAVAPRRLAQLGDTVTDALAEWHRGQPDALGPARAALFRRLRGAVPEAALDAALTGLIAEGRVVRDGAVLRLPGHQPRLTREDERLWQRVEPLLAVDHLRPPRVRELAAALGIELHPLEQFLKRIERFGRVAPVAHNRVYLPATIARLIEVARDLADEAPDRSFTAGAFKDRSGIGRNLTIEVLEYLDRIGVTRRVGDSRTVMRDADAAFG